jgi:5-methylcytosine-specific restriction endonuclease McrA
MSAYVSVELQQQVRSHFQECCAYCHTCEPLSVVPFEMEHIIPLSVGGSNWINNPWSMYHCRLANESPQIDSFT